MTCTEVVMGRGWLTRGWLTYMFGVTAAVAAYLVVPDGPAWEVGFLSGISLCMMVALLAGLRRVPAGDRSPWWSFTVAVAGTVLAPVPSVLGDQPDLGDYLYLAFYPAMATGLVLMIRQSQRRIDWAAVVDALTVTAGIGLLTWAYAAAPVLRDTGTPLGDRLVSVAYLIGDLVLLAMTLVLLRSNGRQGRRAPLLVALAMGGYLAGDWAWVVVPHLNAGWADLGVTTRLINAEYLMSVLVLTLAIIRPRVRGDGLGAKAVSQLSRSQLAVLTAAMLISPALLIAQHLTGGPVDVVVVALGSTVMFLLVMARFTQLLKQSERQAQVVRELSRRDELTGLPNRRAWTDTLPRTLEQARADGTPVIVGMIDLDHFKKFNDTYGHPAGDRLLEEAAAAWSSQLRRTDVLARYGGEEFIVLLPASSLVDATAVVERLRGATPLDQTFSAGLALWDGVETSESLIARADTALYAAKSAGRDRICTATVPDLISELT
ncbi:MAG: diguanylate cyclase [Actinoplanes sp.]